MKYTEDQLREAARELGLAGSIGFILETARKSSVSGSAGWRDEVLRKAAGICRRSVELEKILLVVAQQLSDSEEETITYRELEQYYERVQAARNVMGGAKLEASRVIRDIEAHREKLLDGRTYRSAAGGYYQWDRDSESFRVFGEVAGVPRSLPERPLELLP